MLRRTPMNRTAFKSVMQATKPCAVCHGPFVPARPMQRVCGMVCARKVPVIQRKQEAAETRARKEAIKKPSKSKAEAQDEFNKWVRARDAFLPCISCGTVNPPMKPGGQWDAGHFLSRGAYPELAFNEDNCHKQCKSCNAGSGKFSHKARTVSQAYEVNLLARIGADRLAALKGPHPPAMRSQDDFEQLKVTYRAKLKALKEGRP
ncbi:recombination protein NinG [uncultured Ramlibacter sp.]|uniref:recombination protein NinG n=1 Tax=uncultured Ramlibacter sp. TaxID=260755 RepID=UPI00261B8245|nr:recombination protein NinG [uncultured Ramlibacter sp.]